VNRGALEWSAEVSWPCERVAPEEYPAFRATVAGAAEMLEDPTLFAP
jgi:hypothetical protein